MRRKYIKDMENNITFRRNDDGKWTAIVRGGRAEKVFKSKKSYNRKENKEIEYDN